MPLTRRTFIASLTASMAALAAPALAGDVLPEVHVTKDPTCGCCAKWIEHLRASGFPVSVTEGPVAPARVRLGVPRELASCHTATVDGYVLEGHVPAAEVRRLLDERPAATGLAVPGMPMESPGMEVGGEPAEYEVILFGPSGRSAFARYRGGERV